LQSRESDYGFETTTTITTIQPITIEYARVAHVKNEALNQFKDDQARTAAAAAAGKASGQSLRASGVFVAGAVLEPPHPAMMASARDGKRLVHDGPFAESKEFIGGFVIIDVPNLDAALERVSRNPSGADASIEGRPLTGSYFAAGDK